MIGYLQGKVIFADGVQAILLTESGIGYEVFYNQYLKENSSVGIFTSHIVREADETLFGFKSLKDKQFFELLLGVNGVGPKSAYSLITSIGAANLVTAITMEDSKTLKTAQGIGKKAADQLILSLKDKVTKMYLEDAEPQTVDMNIIRMDSPNDEVKDSNPELVQETILALESLGYKDTDVMPLIKKNITGVNKSEDLIKTILREL